MYDLGAQLQFREISYTVRQLTDSCIMYTREKTRGIAGIQRITPETGREKIHIQAPNSVIEDLSQ